MAREPVVLLYYRHFAPPAAPQFQGVNVDRIDVVSQGVFQVIFSKKLKDDVYVAVASSTSGFVSLTKNNKAEITLQSFDTKGGVADETEIFLAIYELSA